jgi:proteasome-associated ATPase
MAQEADSRPLEILEKAIADAPPDDPKLQNQLSALRTRLQSEAKEAEESKRLIAEYEEAYSKLTSPANRLGVYLSSLDDGVALVALGETEYVASVDPKLPHEQLVAGARVKLNEAYAVVGVLPSAGNGPLVKVTESMEDGRLRVGNDVPGSEGRLVYRGASLSDAQIQAGDEVRLESHGRVAVEHFAKKEIRDYFFEEVPELPWEKVGGQQHAIQLIKDTIEHPLLYPEIYSKFDKKPIKGILLFGPPGCGKTLIGKATAYNLTREYAEKVGHEVQEYFMYISGPKILNMWLGETERMVREIFSVAREKAKEGRLVFLFVDEAESVLRTRSSGRWLNISNTVVPQFCAELDGLVSLENVVLILTSNRPDYIDPAVLRPERIDRKVKVGRPDRQATMQILDIYLHANIPLDQPVLDKYGGDVDCARAELIEEATAYLWRQAKESEFLRVHLRSGSSETLYWKDLVSGALLKSIVDRAKDLAIKRAIKEPSAPHGVSLEDLKAAADAEYKENEIFPKSDTMDDWLKLLDYDPENVASVKPIGPERRSDKARKTIL